MYDFRLDLDFMKAFFFHIEDLQEIGMLIFVLDFLNLATLDKSESIIHRYCTRALTATYLLHFVPYSKGVQLGVQSC